MCHLHLVSNHASRDRQVEYGYAGWGSQKCGLFCFVPLDACFFLVPMLVRSESSNVTPFQAMHWQAYFLNVVSYKFIEIALHSIFYMDHQRVTVARDENDDNNAAHLLFDSRQESLHVCTVCNSARRTHKIMRAVWRKCCLALILAYNQGDHRRFESFNHPPPCLPWLKANNQMPV